MPLRPIDPSQVADLFSIMASVWGTNPHYLRSSPGGVYISIHGTNHRNVLVQVISYDSQVGNVVLVMADDFAETRHLSEIYDVQAEQEFLDNLTQHISSLTSQGPAPRVTAFPGYLFNILDAQAEAGASDVHFKASLPVYWAKYGEQLNSVDMPVGPATMEDMLRWMTYSEERLSSEQITARLQSEQYLELTFDTGRSRARAVFITSVTHGLTSVFRLLPALTPEVAPEPVDVLSTFTQAAADYTAEFDYVTARGSRKHVTKFTPSFIRPSERHQGKKILVGFVEQEDGTFVRKTFRTDRITNLVRD
jgi:hypothetical protein